MVVPKENDPLIVKGEKAKWAAAASSKNKCFRPCRSPLGAAISALIVIFAASALMIFMVRTFHHSRRGATTLDGGQPMAEISDSGEYVVHYARNITATTTTFSELAKIMLPPWYDASLLAMNDALQPDTMDPSSVHEVRKVLLTARDLLDVFSPVYPKKSLWGTLRSYYKTGYDTVGYYQDLDHAHIDYSKDLWDERRDVVLAWKQDFLSFTQIHNVELILNHRATKGCHRHKESHLFWEDRKGAPPCGRDLATPSLQRLASVQLRNSLTYLEIISSYDSVVADTHEQEFHNLRKEIRSFLDEYELFGFIILPDASRFADSIDILTETRTILGEINDHWTAYHIYNTRNEHVADQATLASEIDDEWNKFKQWAVDKDLHGVIQELLDEMKS